MKIHERAREREYKSIDNSVQKNLLSSVNHILGTNLSSLLTDLYSMKLMIQIHILIFKKNKLLKIFDDIIYKQNRVI